MANDAMRERITEVSGDSIGVMTGLFAARSRLGDEHVATFLDQVSEKGGALWDRFQAFREASKSKGAEVEMGFMHFIASVVAPHLLGVSEGDSAVSAKDGSNPMREQITSAIRRALQGTRKARVTFKREAGVLDIASLLFMADGGSISLTEGGYMVLLAVVLSGKWCGDRNRTYEVTLTSKFDENLFVSKMSTALEKIEVVS